MIRVKWLPVVGLAGLLPCALLALTAPVGAQQRDQGSEEEEGGSAGQLELPASITMYGKADPNVRKATAIVNGEVITETDVQQRLALIILANQGKISDEEKERLRLQMLRNLIDETLKIQEAATKKIVVDKGELEENYARVANNFKYSPTGFAKYLTAQGSSAASIKRQIEGEVAWSRLLRREVQPFVNVSEDEVKAVIDRLKAAKGSDELRIGEIYLSAPVGNTAKADATAQQIMTQLRQGGSFVAYAKQYSEASTAAVGGDLGWVRPAQLPDELAQVAQTMDIGQIAGPVALPGGMSILYLMDKRKVLTADPRDASLSLKQIGISFPAGTTDEQARPKIEAFAAAITKIKGCGGVADIAAQLNAEVVPNDGLRARELPGQLQNMVLALQVGEATQAYGSVKDGIRALVLCGRDDPVDASQPSFDAVMSKMEEERVNKRASTYLRDLRRDAVIDYN